MMANPLSVETIALVKASVPALAARGPDITKVMYRRMFKNDDFRSLFDQANQDNGAQPFARAAATLAYAQNVE